MCFMILFLFKGDDAHDNAARPPVITWFTRRWRPPSSPCLRRFLREALQYRRSAPIIRFASSTAACQDQAMRRIACRLHSSSTEASCLAHRDRAQSSCTTLALARSASHLWDLVLSQCLVYTSTKAKKATPIRLSVSADRAAMMFCFLTPPIPPPSGGLFDTISLLVIILYWPDRSPVCVMTDPPTALHSIHQSDDCLDKSLCTQSSHSVFFCDGRLVCTE